MKANRIAASQWLGYADNEKCALISSQLATTGPSVEFERRIDRADCKRLAQKRKRSCFPRDLRNRPFEL